MHIEMEEFSDVRFKQRAVIEFLTAEKVPPIEIHRRIQAVYGDQCVDVSTVRCWVRRFKDGVHIEMEEFSDVRFKQRAVIEFLTTVKVPPIEFHRLMQAVYGDHCVDVSTVRCWVRRFKDGELGQADLSDKIQRTDFKN